MRYLPKSPADREEMLAAINATTPGVASIDDLFATIPAEYQLKRDLAVSAEDDDACHVPKLLQRETATTNANAE